MHLFSRLVLLLVIFFFFSSRRRHTRFDCDWSSDVCSSDLHRYTGVLVQDAAYMVVVPNVTPDTPPLAKNPVFLYMQDRFQRPNPFRPDVAINLDDVWEQKMDALDAHVSQFYEWLP